ncbi:tyrosine-type recombinase/integrase [Holophaga foetida]|uniref:tyrosine-type recombinase/integrase n=1 Tax=Holophaga foetida TaxID=35839 RepID=UPI0002473338|nr:integrase arm-type DNA-binding domain-containing protein [Holophaga foetida]
MGRASGVNLTKSVIEGLGPRDTLFRVSDAQTRGLELQVTPAGVRSWVLRYRVHGHQKTFTLGRWPELTVALARKSAHELLAGIANGEDPGAKRKAEREAETVNELVTRFKKEHLPTLKQSTLKEYERLLDKEILPGLGAVRVKDVQPSDVASLLSRVRAGTAKGIVANRTRAVLSKMFSLASLWGLRPGLSNPAQGQARSPETKKDRHLSDKELVALGAALRHLEPAGNGEERPLMVMPPEDQYALAAIRLALLTGMRKSELIGHASRKIPALTWDNVNLDAGVIRLEQHKTSKRTGARVVSLCGAAVDLLEHLPKTRGNPFVFPGRKEGKALSHLQGVWVRVRAIVHVVQRKTKVPKNDWVSLEDVTIHDLRRSFASVAARMGYPELIVAALLGHAAGTVTAGYARLGADPLRDVVEAIGARMEALLDGHVDVVAEAKVSRAGVRARGKSTGI